MSATTESLNKLLADYQVFYQKLRTYHWTVQGPMFFDLHNKFEELYLDAATKVDDLAERIVALKGRPLPTLKTQVGKARLAEDEDDRSAQEMVGNLVSDLEQLNGSLREASKQAESAGDAATFNLLEGMADGQEKTAWMLRAYLG